MACDHSQPCGCNQDELTTLPDPCDTTECVGEPCDEIIDCNCVRYNGAAIPQLDIAPGDSLCDIITDLIGLGGIPGASAYDIWIAEGNVGTEQDFLDSLIGQDGTDGTPGLPGLPGTAGSPGARGDDGNIGPAGDYLETSEEPAGVNCFNGGVKIVTRDGVTNAILNTEYVCNAGFKMMMAQAYGPGINQISPIPNINKNLGDTASDWSVFRSGQNLLLGPGSGNLLIDDWGASYNVTTGIWTCPEDGYYDISYYLHLTQGTKGTDDYTTWGPGTFIACIMDPAHGNQYGGSSVITNSDMQHLDIEGNRLMVPIPRYKKNSQGQPDPSQPYQLVLRVLNKTTNDYVAIEGDVVRFAIRKVRNF